MDIYKTDYKWASRLDAQCHRQHTISAKTLVGALSFSVSNTQLLLEGFLGSIGADRSGK